MPASLQKPPRLAEALLRWSVGPEDAEVIGGDLEETLNEGRSCHDTALAERIWYWRQVISILVAHVFASGDEWSHLQTRGTIMATIRQDLLQAFRVLRKQPAFTAVAGVERLPSGSAPTSPSSPSSTWSPSGHCRLPIQIA